MNSPADPVFPTPPPAPPSRPPTSQQIFVGPNGIRAGWRFLIFAALLYLFLGLGLRLPAISRIQSALAKGTLTPTLDIALEVVFIGSVFLATFIMSRIEKRRFSSYGIPLKRALGKLFWQGVLFGLALMSLEMLLIAALGGFSFGNIALSGGVLAKYAAAWALSFVLVGVNEEFTFRGYAQFTLATGIGFWPSALLLSALFGAVHLSNPNEGWVGALSVLMFGLFACFTLRRTGNLWFAIGFHAAADYAETFIYSVPDSGFLATGHLLNSSLHASPLWLTGGAIGPEGSVFVFLLLGLAFPVFAWLYPDKPEQTIGSRESSPTAA